MSLLDAAEPGYAEGHSESRPHTLSWILDLLDLGVPDGDVTADTPCYSVFRSEAARTYVAFNWSEEPREVRFSDGTSLHVGGSAAALLRRQHA